MKIYLDDIDPMCMAFAKKPEPVPEPIVEDKSIRWIDDHRTLNSDTPSGSREKISVITLPAILGSPTRITVKTIAEQIEAIEAIAKSSLFGMPSIFKQNVAMASSRFIFNQDHMADAQRYASNAFEIAFPKAFGTSMTHT